MTKAKPNPDSTLHDRVAFLLDSMGEAADAVAATLRVEEVRGVRGSAVAHPLCWWLIRLVPDACVVLGKETVHATLPGVGPSRQDAVVALPVPVRTFVDQFDGGQHPDLELWLGNWTPATSGPAGGSGDPDRPDRAPDRAEGPAGVAAVPEGPAGQWRAPEPRSAVGVAQAPGADGDDGGGI
jgi:hypothetical protein